MYCDSTGIIGKINARKIALLGIQITQSGKPVELAHYATDHLFGNLVGIVELHGAGRFHFVAELG
ncbi:uncharacterized protein sS8_5225 [Methylocaldum marinum]|uniref:Uncharacterized protein n=1 Tax=Methylocaldum marinum TaxID=1432792 RepID=A0A250KZV4_9GAMM|nr:uncharacterized protein sS8_5225 [Methylocaldum marinum]